MGNPNNVRKVINVQITARLYENPRVGLINSDKILDWGDDNVKLFNVNDGAILRRFMHHTGTVTSLALLPDGLRFVSGGLDRTARIVYHGLAPQ